MSNVAEFVDQTIDVEMRRIGPGLVAVILFYVFLGQLNLAGNLRVPGAQAFSGMTAGLKIISGIVIGLFFAINYLHYYYDRCYYSFSNPEVRRHVAPLVFGARAS